MDITTDGFGFMLAVGDLAWVPFVYSLQARYLVFKPVELGPVWTTAVFLVNLTGYYIFRAANGEKNDFRNGRNPKSEYQIPSGHVVSDNRGLGQILNSLRLPADLSCLLLGGGVAHDILIICVLVQASSQISSLTDFTAATC